MIPLRARRAAGSVLVLATVLLTLLGGSTVRAQTVLRIEEDLEADRPEAWAMAWFGSVTLMTRLGEPAELAPGRWSLGLEGAWIPHLTEDQRRVGFDGQKVEDLNRSPVLGRLRAAVGLPGGLVLGLGWLPPATIDGIDPEGYAVSLGRPLVVRGGWRLDARVVGQLSRFQGDITCDRAAVAAGNDPVRNPFLCEEPSRDRIEVRSGSLELTLGLGRPERAWRPSVGVLATRFDNTFRVRARYGGLVDRTVLRAEQWNGAVTAGIRYRSDRPLGLAAELLYAPLDAERGLQGRGADDLLHARLQLVYHLP